MGYAQNINGIDTVLLTDSQAQDIESLNTVLQSSAPLQGIRLLTPADGEINVSVTPAFDWESDPIYGAYEIEIADNDQFTNSIKAWVTASDYNETVALLNNTNYHWRVTGGDLVDNPVIVPDTGITVMTVWDATTDPAPIYYPNDIYPQSGNTPDGVAPLVKEAAYDLSSYIAQSSNKTAPQVIPVPKDYTSFPTRCIKVGFPNPALTQREEIQIKCDGSILEITGKDVFNPQVPDWVSQRTELNYMNQAGTYNAIMTFLHENMGIVWGWTWQESGLAQGESPLGEAVPSLSELKVNVVDKTHTPSFKIRNHLRLSQAGNGSGYGISKTIQKKWRHFYCLQVRPGHPLISIYDKYHPNSTSNDFIEDRQEIFALQPDGTRDGFPYNNNSKYEMGGDAMINFFLDVWFPQKIAENPLKEVLSTSQNDGFLTGYSRDPRLLSMDYPERGFATGGNTTTIIDSNREYPFVVNDLVGETVKIVNYAPSIPGTNFGEERTITANDEDSITVGTPFSSPIDTTSFYEVQRSGLNYFTGVYSDRSVTDVVRSDGMVVWANKMYEAFKLKYPDRTIKSAGSYGSTRFAPVKNTLNAGIVHTNVSNSFTDPTHISSVTGQTHAQNLEDWLAVTTSDVLWRPNLGSGYGHEYAMALSQVNRIGNRLKELNGLGVNGFVADTLWEHYSTQWPLYYVMSQLMWDSSQEVSDIMNKAYTTLFGDASSYIKQYYESIETTLESNYQHGSSNSAIADLYPISYTNTLQGYLNSALGSVNSGTIEHDRCRWVQEGLNWMKGVAQSCRYFAQYNAVSVVSDQTNLADGANAVETDVDATTGWTRLYSTFPFTSQSVETNGSSFAFFLDGNSPDNGISKGILRDQALDIDAAGNVSGTATSGTSGQLTETGKALTENAHVGRVLRMTSGANSGEQRPIDSNTADTIVLEYSFNTSVASGDTYEIVDMYQIIVIAKHTGVGQRWAVGAENSTDFTTAATISPDDTDWKEYKINLYGGDKVRIRNADNDADGAIYVDTVEIKKAKPIDRVGIANEWNAHNSDIVSAVKNSEWYNSNRPIGSAPLNENGSNYIPTPNSSDITDPGFGDQ